MKITLTNEEYERLAQMLMIASYVLTGYDAEPDEEKKALLDLEQKIFAVADEAGMGETICFDDELDVYAPVYEYEDQVLAKYIDSFTNEAFWNELADRLGERDVRDSYGEERFSRMHESAREELIVEKGNWYYEQLQNRGIDLLSIRPPFKLVK